MIEHDNIIYMPTISALGGIETYVYELVKKYHDLDIAVVTKKCDEKQAARIKKYCRLYIYTGQEINCKVAIINYDQGIISHICDGAKIYQAIHADYTHPRYDHKPHPHPRVTAFIAITKFIQNSMKDILHPNNIILSYNPLTIDDTKPIIIVSATRLYKEKGVARMQKVIDEMDRVGINYLWFVLTGDKNTVHGNNIIELPPRLDVDKFMSIATYVALFSDSEACSYLLNEGLYRNIPILTTPLPYLEEIGYKDGVNGYTLDFDCKNLKDFVSKLPTVPKFTFKKLDDSYSNILAKGKSKYEDDLYEMVRVRAITKYFDVEENCNKKINDEWVTNKVRADHLVYKKKVIIIDSK